MSSEISTVNTLREHPWLYTPGPSNPARRWLVILLLLAIVTGFSWVVYIFHVSTNPGVDQNGYLVTARLMVEKGRIWYTTQDPYQFAGKMCVMPQVETIPKPGEVVRYYAKYPFGYPLLAAGAYLLGGIPAMYWVNPICAILAVWLSYFMFRQALAPTISLIGTILLATNPLILYFANDANSHASSLLFIVLGFWGLLSWWRTDSLWKGIVGAFALGFACTIRYTEFLFVLPVVFAVLANFQRSKRGILSSGLIILSWGIPVAVLALVCWIHFGAPWKNGYSFCNEDTAFGWKYFVGENNEPTNFNQQGNWATLIQQMNHIGFFVFWPLALAGLMVSLMRVWRLGMLLLLWVIPSMVLYMCYYWAPQGENSIWYLRFFVDLVPGFIFAALWLIERSSKRHGIEAETPSQPQDSRASFWAGLGLLTAVSLLTAFWIICDFSPEPPAGIIPNTANWWKCNFSTQDNNWRFILAGGFLLLLLLVLLWERKWVSRVAPATVALGSLVALSSSINLLNTVPQMNSMYVSYQQLQQNLRTIRSVAPSGALVITTEQMCDALDSEGGYQLYDSMLFSNLNFNYYFAIFNRNLNETDDPHPVQWDRARYYLQVTGQKVYSGIWLWNATRDFLKVQGIKINPKQAFWQKTQFWVEKIGWHIDPGVWTIKDAKERIADQVEIFRSAATAGQRILVVRRVDDKNLPVNLLIPNVKGVSSKRIAYWVNTPGVDQTTKSWFVKQPNKAPAKTAFPPAPKWEILEVQINLAFLSTEPNTPPVVAKPALSAPSPRTVTTRPAATSKAPTTAPATARRASNTTRPATQPMTQPKANSKK